MQFNFILSRLLCFNCILYSHCGIQQNGGGAGGRAEKCEDSKEANVLILGIFSALDSLIGFILVDK